MGSTAKRYRVGSVPYVNARPLVLDIEQHPGDYPVEVLYKVPSKLPGLLDSGEADAVLASSIDALLSLGRKIAGGLCIGSRGPVLSVRLFSKVPIPQIRSLALDQSSLTSNGLAQIILAERYGVRPSTEKRPPSLEKMLAEFDACILIGDIGMRADGTGLHVLDLGAEWTELTGLPFVWALWIGGTRLDSELVTHLQRAKEESRLGAGKEPTAQQQENLIAISSASSWTLEEVRRYLMETIVFDLGDAELEGLCEFGKRLVKNSIANAKYFPELVLPAATEACR